MLAVETRCINLPFQANIQMKKACCKINAQRARNLNGLFSGFVSASNIVFMSTKAVLVDFGLSVQMTEDIYYPKDLRGTEVRSWRDKSTYDVLLPWS